MTQRLELYKCEVCGNLVEVVIEGGGALVCCSQPMKLIEPKKEEIDLSEKHLPDFRRMAEELVVEVGSVPHPMTEEHYIQFIEVHSKDKKYVKRKYLTPQEEPTLTLKCKDIGPLDAVELCNIHGLWGASYDEH